MKDRRSSSPSSRATRHRSTRSRGSRSGPRCSATRASRSRAGTRGCSIWRRRREVEDLLRRDHGRLPRGTASRSPSSRPTSRASWSPCIRPTTRASTASRRRRCAAIRKRASAGRSSRCSRPPRPRATSAWTPASTFSGALAWPYLYPWPPRSPGLIEAAFDELAKRWKPIFDAYRRGRRRRRLRAASGRGHASTATTFEMFLERVGNHPRCGINYDPSHFVLQQLDYLDFIDIYHERITRSTSRTRSSTRPAGRASTPASRAGSSARAASARSATARSTSARSSPSSPQYDYDRWPVLEWECALKHPEQGAAKARRSSRATSSGSPSTPSTTSPAAQPT